MRKLLKATQLLIPPTEPPPPLVSAVIPHQGGGEAADSWATQTPPGSPGIPTQPAETKRLTTASDVGGRGRDSTWFPRLEAGTGRVDAPQGCWGRG